MQDLPHILNWRRWDDRITLSGQPSEHELTEISGLGISHVINLSPHSDKGALADERQTVTDLGMNYVHIPVDFEHPTDADFQSFCDAIENSGTDRTHVHCIYNARVSAFFYRYAQNSKTGSEKMAFKLMDGIWRPGGVWANFINKQEDTKLPNRYAGEDY